MVFPNIKKNDRNFYEVKRYGGEMMSEKTYSVYLEDSSMYFYSHEQNGAITFTPFKNRANRMNMFAADSLVSYLNRVFQIDTNNSFAVVEN